MKNKKKSAHNGNDSSKSDSARFAIDSRSDSSWNNSSDDIRTGYITFKNWP